MKKLEIVIKNILLNILLLFNSVVKSKSKIELNKNSKILFIRLNKIGDALVTTPLIKLIKEKTGCSISVLADTKNHFVFNDESIYNEVIVFKKGISNFFKTVNLINSKKYDVIVDLHDDISTTVSFLISSLNCEKKVALCKGNGNLYSHIVIKRDPSVYHVVDRVMEFASIFNLDYEKDKVNIHYPSKENSVKIIDEFITNNFDNKLLLGINISAGNEARFWGVDNFKNLLNSLNKYDINICLLSTENEKYLAEKISENKFKIFTNSDFNVFSEMISKLDFLFTPDTSVVHLASANKIPMFGIYVKYNTDNMIWSPYRSQFDSVVTNEPNFKNLSSEKVINKFIPFFEKFYETRNT